MQLPLYILIGLLTLSGCSKPGTPLSLEQLNALLNRDRQVAWTAAGFSGQALLKANGKGRLTVTGFGEDTGKWWIKNDQACSKWNKAIKGVETCVIIGILPNGNYDARLPTNNIKLGEFSFSN